MVPWVSRQGNWSCPCCPFQGLAPEHWHTLKQLKHQESKHCTARSIGRLDSEFLLNLKAEHRFVSCLMFLSACAAVSALAQPHFSIIFLPMSMVAARIYVLKSSIVQLGWQVEWRPSSFQKTVTQKLEKVAKTWENSGKNQAGSSVQETCKKTK